MASKPPISVRTDLCYLVPLTLFGDYNGPNAAFVTSRSIIGHTVIG